MPQSFDKAPDYINTMIADVASRWHLPLPYAGVTIAVLFATEYDKDSGEMVPTLQHGGYPAAAIIKPTSLKERALGVADAVLIIDEYVWAELNEAQQVALLDHELTHLEVINDGGGTLFVNDGQVIGEPKKDDLQRPRLRTRKHDFQLGCFKDVMRRHRDDSVEMLQIRSACDERGQLSWAFKETPQLDAAQQEEA